MRGNSPVRFLGGLGVARHWAHPPVRFPGLRSVKASPLPQREGALLFLRNPPGKARRERLPSGNGHGGTARMFGFLKGKFEKEAQAAIDKRARQLAPGKAPKPAPAPPLPAPDREQAIAHMQAQVKDFITPERQALIANAMKVHRAKQQILADLDDESRAKLVAMAITAFLRQGPEPEPTPKAKKK